MTKHAFKSLYLSVCMHVRSVAACMPQHICRDQRTTLVLKLLGSMLTMQAPLNVYLLDHTVLGVQLKRVKHQNNSLWYNQQQNPDIITANLSYWLFATGLRRGCFGESIPELHQCSKFSLNPCYTDEQLSNPDQTFQLHNDTLGNFTNLSFVCASFFSFAKLR